MMLENIVKRVNAAKKPEAGGGEKQQFPEI